MRLLILLLLLPFIGATQLTYYIRSDSVKIMKQGGSNELILQNSTRGTKGLLTNVGNGLTRFIGSRISGDTLFIGVDTILNVGTSGSSVGGSDRYLYYSINFGQNSYTNGDLTDGLVGATANYFHNGLVLKAPSTTITSSYLTATNYGYLINENTSQKIVFQVMDSSSIISIGVGIKGSGAVNPRDQYTTIVGTIGDSANTDFDNVQTTAGDNKTSSGVLINKGDIIQITLNQWADSVVTIYENKTNNNTIRLVRQIFSTVSTSSTRMGYPTLFFGGGHVRLIDWSIYRPDFDILWLGNSIAVGHNASKFDTSYVGRLQEKTASRINNASRSAGTTLDLTHVKEDFNIRNKVVVMDATMGNDVAAGISYADSKTYYAAAVDRLKANGNRIVHCYITYRTTFLGAGTWFDLYQRNKWLDTMYGSVDKIVQRDTLTAAMLDDGVHPNDAGHATIYTSMYRDMPEYFERGRIVGPLTGERLVLTNSSRQMFTHDWFQAKDTLSRPRLVLRGGLVVYDPLSTGSSPIRVSQLSSSVSSPSVFVVNTLNTLNQFGAFAYINASMSAGSNVHLVYGGKAVSLNNLGLFTYNHVGDGDSANYVSVSLHSNEVVRFFGNRRMRVLTGPLEIADLAGKPPTPASGYLGFNGRGDTARVVNDNGVEFTLRLTNSGTFTPTGTASTNVDAVTPFDFHYTRIDNTVTFSGTVDIDETVAAGNTIVELSLPIPSNFAATTDAAGVVTPTNAGIFGGYITASAANDRLVLTVLGVSTGTVTYTFTGSYNIK